MSLSQLITKIVLTLVGITIYPSLPLTSAIAIVKSPIIKSPTYLNIGSNLQNNYILSEISHSQNIQASQNLIKTLILQNKPEAALEISENSRQRAFRDLFTKKLPTINVDPISIEQIKEVAKAQNVTLVEYSLLTEEVNVDGKRKTQESELLIWVIKPTGEITMRRVDLKAWRQREKTSLGDLITRHRNQINLRREYNKGIRVAAEKSKEKYHIKNWEKLHQVLIQPIADLLPKQQGKGVIFIPQSDLFLVSFAALRDKKGKYLIEKYTISTAPSIQVLDLLHQRKNARNGEKSFVPTTMTNDELLIVGNPTAPKKPLTKGDSCKVLNLPGAEKEAKNIARIFNTQALIGDAATETAIVNKMSQARIIHLATMTYPNDCKTNNPPDVIALDSSNQDDGWLRTSEIQNLDLKADLVVLSGCETALGHITGDGVIGLSRSFFAAGADSVIGSLWDIPDIPTAILMTVFHANLSKNTGKAGALRQAILETMKKHPNPRDWAGFTLVGLL
ncbi:CHAT domain-containing protein [Mastigocoleus testarum]|uniref:CHAT domain-containing protein n=1 Tax=Mastigocoleus testarum TaxID=996925 RepID=UPI0009EBE481|nr:CHAT domain-containing protein [Mastigocoleus testarum]